MQHISLYVNKYNLPLTVLLHANCYTPFHGARERVTSGGAVWLVVRVVFVVAIKYMQYVTRRMQDVKIPGKRRRGRAAKPKMERCV